LAAGRDADIFEYGAPTAPTGDGSSILHLDLVEVNVWPGSAAVADR
jgi:hypothetical protein